MQPVIISWTPTNWATIFLMALGGFAIVGLVIKGYQKYKGTGN
jgi:hypothetical protein